MYSKFHLLQLVKILSELKKLNIFNQKKKNLIKKYHIFFE